MPRPLVLAVLVAVAAGAVVVVVRARTPAPVPIEVVGDSLAEDYRAARAADRFGRNPQARFDRSRHPLTQLAIELKLAA